MSEITFQELKHEGPLKLVTTTITLEELKTEVQDDSLTMVLIERLQAAEQTVEKLRQGIEELEKN